MPSKHSLTPTATHELLEALCNSMKEGAAVIERPEGRIIFCNKAWLDIFGLTSLGQMNMKDLTRMRRVTLSETSIQERIQTIEEQGHYFEQVEYVSRSGKPFWADVSVRLFQNNGITYYLVVNDKIDLLKESEMQVAGNKQRLSALLEHASMGILETDNNAEIIDINLSALKLFGYEKHEVLHRKIELLIPQRFHGRHVEHRAHYLDHPKNRPMGLGMDLFAVKKNGEEFPVEVSLTKYTMDGQPYVIAFISDISIRKKNELEIKKLNDELEETVELRTRELKSAIQQVEASREDLYRLLEKEKQLSELKSRFVSMASHEFRTPLSTVLSSAYLLEQYNTGEDAARQQKHLKRIVSSVSILTDTLNDFLSVGKIEEGKIHVKYQEFDLEKLIRSVIEEIMINLKKEQHIEYYHEGDTEVSLDISLLTHIIQNLVSNASKFSPEQGLIEIQTHNNKGLLTLSVKDQGIGISKEDQQHLMERFFRGTNAVNIQGTGLGLHIISKYAELLQGTLQCSSTIGEGTQMIVSFKQNHSTYEKDPRN